MAPNYSLHSIPVFWVLALYPHAHAATVIKKANNNKWNNVNPSGVDTKEGYKKSVPAEVFARYERAEAAHRNMLENAPLYIGAVLVGNAVGLSADTLNAATAAYLGLRVLYIALYVNVTRTKYSFLRTAMWGVSTGILFWLFVKAGNKVM